MYVEISVFRELHRFVVKKCVRNHIYVYSLKQEVGLKIHKKLSLQNEIDNFNRLT